jgi:hypothetical protein
MSFSWSPDGNQLAYTRPDGIGLLNFLDGLLTSELDIIPFQTGSDWAWVPGLSWSPDGSILYTVDHAPSAGLSSQEESPNFDLTAIPVGSGSPFHIVSQTGMFAYPIVSPAQTLETGEEAYCDTSQYQVMVMDRDGSNRSRVFPAGETNKGFLPQKYWGAWSPEPLPEAGGLGLALIAEGNLWIVDMETKQTYQITGDGMTDRAIWVP